MLRSGIFLFGLFFLTPVCIRGQERIPLQIIREATEHSQLEQLGHELLDVIGPRLVGTPQMKNAHDWAVEKYRGWKIPAENQQWGTWQGWERGITHIDLVHPRVQSLHGRQLAWSPGTKKKGITAEIVLLPKAKDSLEFQNSLFQVKGKFVMVSLYQPTGRPDENWEEWARESSLEKMRWEREQREEVYKNQLENTGLSNKELHRALERAGAVGVISSNWSRGFGANKIFDAYTQSIPSVDVSLEDYGLLYRLVENGNQPRIRVVAESREIGEAPTFNTIARIEGSLKPEEYIILSAHFDSWDGGTGATDNGTGTLVMMETMRILKKLYPNPKRTIIAGHWGSEEQGLNGSRAFVSDHPEIVENLQVLFNQDNGTGRVVNINGQGFLHSYDYLGRWMLQVPEEIRSEISTSFPGLPSGGGSDHSSFVAAGAPAFMLGSLSWDYWNYTWHTNLDTYDKIIWDDVRSNVILTAILSYMASEDPERTSREKRILPLDPRTGESMHWPEAREGNPSGGLD